MDTETKKKLISTYKERTIIGGVYLIGNDHNEKIFLDCSVNMEAIKNRFDFACQMGSCVNVKMQKDWALFGSSAFYFEVLETIEKNDTQTDAEFKDDVLLLKSMWLEKFDKHLLY